MASIKVSFSKQTAQVLSYACRSAKDALRIDRRMNEGPEQRRWTRHRIDMRLKVSLAGNSGADPVVGRATSLSIGGLGAYIPCTLMLGSTVHLELSLPHVSGEVKISAVVKSGDGFIYGLEFLRLPFDIRAVIEKSCAEAPAL